MGPLFVLTVKWQSFILQKKASGAIADRGELERVRGAQSGGRLQPGQSLQKPAPWDPGALCDLVLHRLTLRQRR